MKALSLMSRWAIVSAVLPLASAQSNPCLELRTLSPAPSSEAYQNLGNSYLEQGRLSCAAQAFASSFKLKPDDSGLALQLGRTLIADRKFQAARNILEQAISLSPQSYDARMALGAALHELGDLSGALAQWEQAMQLQPQSALALDWIAKTRLELGDATSVVDLLHNAVRDESAEVDLLLASQRAGVLNQEYPVALNRLREHPDWTRLRSALAVTLVQRNRFDEALAVLSAGDGGQDESIHLLKMQVMVLSGSNKDVLPLAVSYLAGHPHDFEALYLAGLVHRRAAEYPAAEDELREAVRLKPSHFDALFNLGAVEVALRQWKSAEEDLRRAIALDANAPEPRFQLATVLRNVGDIPGAKEQLQQYQHLQHLRAEHDRKVSLAAQAAQRLAAHDPAAAVELYRQLLALDEENAATEYNLAMACDATGDVAAEKTALEAAVRINPRFALALNQLGYLQMRSGDPAAAEASCGVDRIRYIIESMGGGCAFFDYDNDGWTDIFIVSGTRLDGAPPQATNRLYRNNRDGTFTDVTEHAGLRSVGWGCGVCVGDYNNDGLEDLFVTSYGKNHLYRNNGDGTFTDVTRQAGLEDAGVRFATGCSFLDYNRDGLLDLFVANYVIFDLDHAPVPSVDNPTCSFQGLPVYCGPRGLQPGRHSLYRNNGDGTFTDVSVASGVAALRDSYGMTVVTGDFDNDGWPDIFVAADSSPSLLLMNNHDGTFHEEALERGVAVSGEGAEQAGMGVGAGDMFNQGSTSLFVTHFLSETSGLYRNNGSGVFTDETLATRLGVETRYVGWGAAVADFDNDGWPDILWATGNVYPEIEHKFPAYPLRGPRPLFRNLGDGTFEELTTEGGAALNERHASRGLAVGDFDNDGDLDILIVNLNQQPSLLRNDAPAGRHWLKVLLVGTRSNRSAIGAQVTVLFDGRKQMQERVSQSSYLSSSENRIHFGLGTATKAEVFIRWPSGLQEHLSNVPVDRLITVHEGMAAHAGIAPLPKART